METNKYQTSHKHSSSKGFALLLTLIVISILISVGLGILYITSKQQSLSIVGRESELAFQASSAGMECMRYQRKVMRSSFLNEGSGSWPPAPECAGVSPSSYNEKTLLKDTGGGRYLYSYFYTYNLDNGTCIDTSLYITDMRESNSDLDIPIFGEGLERISCTAGTVCTTIFSRGYNRPCDQLDTIFTVERELTIEF